MAPQPGSQSDAAGAFQATSGPTPESASAESVLRAFAAVVSPSLLGAFLIVCVVTGWVGSELQRSSVVSAIALVVGAVLILGSGAIYAWHPERYEDHRTMDAEQLEALAREIRRLTRGQSAGSEVEPAPPPPSPVTSGRDAELPR